MDVEFMLNDSLEVRVLTMLVATVLTCAGPETQNTPPQDLLSGRGCDRRTSGFSA